MTREHFNVVRNEVHFRAFLPSPKHADLSVMRTHDLSEPEVWALGQEAAIQSGRTVFARGDLTAPQVRNTFTHPWHLNVAPDEPPVRHASIKGWPPATESEIRKSLAQQLRAMATAHGRPA